ncbi:uncharacterized protein ACA1_287770 [Acanthamoeba castellanii str. Neff]|uniref:Uncharacterized protein n=1 Tax=Acanthamoeba castellanii (strain ATCC 30010 / Neff) TaxID=1257118 RepID=L8HL24_ACACF|nr:uncharacterized protein ACA1_287770 [Acanthamoeba castellanii str. Neff]ELR25076.1 hypothetical protein ACA1_287770 [Acanthamoeba castellanii str. Neff]
MVSLKELVMAELSPWRMKDVTTIPINGRTISKNRRGGKSALRLTRLRYEILHNFHMKAHDQITARWFSVLVVGVVEPVKPEPFSGDSFPSACRVVEPVALPHGGSRGLQSDESTPRYVTFPDLGPALREGKIETLLISEELLDKWLVVRSSQEGSTAEAERWEDWHLLDVVPRQDEARVNHAEALDW